MVGAFLSMLCLLAQMFGPQEAQAARAGRAPSNHTATALPACQNQTGAQPGGDRARVETRLDACRQALLADADNPRLHVGMAAALSAAGQHQDAVRHLRAAAARDDVDALFRLYEIHNAYDRRDGAKPMVPRAAAAYALQRAAELGHPQAMLRLAATLERGGLFKRDLAGARFWTEQALGNPPPGMDRGEIAVQLGRLLAKSENAEERNRGLAILETLAETRGDAQAEFAIAIRGDDPFRARDVLEQVLLSHPGLALAPLADMLLKGEGGQKDQARAITLLSDRLVSDIPSVSVAKGRLLLEGRIVERDLQRGVELLDHEARWDYATMLELMTVLASNPKVSVSYPSGLLHAATEAADLGEPGAADALVALKLSGHVQFGDLTGGCSLAARAEAAGDAAARRVAACPQG